MQRTQERIRNSSIRTIVTSKVVKKFGKYFLKSLTEGEYSEWKKTNSGILWDIKTEE